MDPVDLSGPHVATAAEDLEPGFHPARPQLTALDDGEVWLSYSMAGRRIRAVPSFDGGITWPESLGAVEDREVRGGGPSNVVGLDGGWGVAWEHFVFEGDSLFFTHVDRRGFPTGPPRLIGDNLGGEVRQIGYYAPHLSSSNDTIVCTWRQTLRNPSERRLQWSVSYDGGLSWLQPNAVLTDRFRNSNYSGPVLTSTDGGDHFVVYFEDVEPARLLVRRFVPDQSDWDEPRELSRGAVQLDGQPFIAAGGSEIGVVAMTLVNPDAPPVSVRFWLSRDDGDTWAEPVLVSTELLDINHFDPHLARDVFGRWHAAWLASSPFSFDFNVYYSVSSDGVSWSSPIRVNPELDSAGVDVPESIAISTDADGHVYIAYEYGFGANAEAIHVMTTRQRAYDPADVPSALEASTAPNPFRLSTNLTLRSPAPGTADVRIFDAAGRLVREWGGVLLFGGITTMTWDGRFTSGRSAPAGVYYWRATMETEAGRRRARAKAVYLGR